MATLVVIVTAAVSGTVLRALSWPRWLVTLVQGVALLLVITWMYASDVALLAVVPGPEVWQAFSTLVDDGTNVINDEVAPITVTTGVQFLVVVGVAFIAWVVDAIAITWRHATMAGVPLLGLYLVPAIVLPDGVPWPLFLLAGAGWLILLLTDGRRELLRWGRPVDGNTSSRLHSVGGTGRRLGAAALTVAVVVPVILPTLDDGRFGVGGSGGDGTGDGSSDPEQQVVLTVNPITNLRRDLRRGPDTPAFTYSTDAEIPEYFRLATLDSFSAGAWTLEELEAGSDQQAANGLPQPPGLGDNIAQSTAEYSVSIDGLDSPRLPLPYPVSVVNIDGDWRYDAESFDVFSAEEDGSSQGQAYTATQRVIAPTAEQLRAAGTPDIDSSFTEVPDDTEAVLESTTLNVTSGAATDFDRALQIQNWFRTEFDYSLDTVDGNDNVALQKFLADRSGYCEQFAATMALMARIVDIPARVQVGFTPGEEVADNIWAVTAHDAHAWPELWFEGVGWVRFEPTPGGGDGGGTPIYAPNPQESQVNTGPNKNSGGVNKGGVNQLPGGRGTLRELRKAERGATGFNDGGTGSSSDEGDGSSMWLWLSLLGVAAAVAVAPATALRLTRRRRWQHVTNSAQAVEAAWADILDAATDVDLGAEPTETPRDLAARLPRLSGLTNQGANDLRQLAGWVERLRYGGTALELPEPVAIHDRSEQIRTQIFESLSSRDRRQAQWWPASGRLALFDSWNDVAESIGERSQGASAEVAGWFRRRPRDVAPTAPRSGS
jgi:transglutaminase-like putative cysteine protease